jgi:hypothetical protein
MMRRTGRLDSPIGDRFGKPARHKSPTLWSNRSNTCRSTTGPENIELAANRTSAKIEHFGSRIRLNKLDLARFLSPREK